MEWCDNCSCPADACGCPDAIDDADDFAARDEDDVVASSPPPNDKVGTPKFLCLTEMQHDYLLALVQHDLDTSKHEEVIGREVLGLLSE